VTNNKDPEIKLKWFYQKCGTIIRKLQKEARKDTQVKLYRAMAIQIHMDQKPGNCQELGKHKETT
jgi:hypothetical protein